MTKDHNRKMIFMFETEILELDTKVLRNKLSSYKVDTTSQKSTILTTSTSMERNSEELLQGT